MRDQTQPAAEIAGLGDGDLSTRLAACKADFVLFLSDQDSLAPQALARVSQALARASVDGIIVRAEAVDSNGMPQTPLVEAPGDGGEFLLGWGRAFPFVTAQAMLRRDRVQSVLRLPGVSRPEDVIAAIVARYRVLFLEDILVRRRMANQGTGFPEAVLAGRLLEDLCFQLGGGRWADPLARAQVRNQLADSLDARGQHARQAAQLREAARALQGNAIPGSSTESGMIRSFAHIPRWKLPRSGVAAVENWGSTIDVAAGPDIRLGAALSGSASGTPGLPPDTARAAMRAEVRALGDRVEEWRRVLAGYLDATTELPELAPAELPAAGIGAAADWQTPAPCVAFEVPSLDAGGMENVVATLARQFSSQGFRALVICDERGGSLAEELADEGIEVFVLGAHDPEGELAVFLSDQNVDVLAAHYSWLGIPAAVAQDIPVVMTVHNEYGWMGAAPDQPLRALDPFVHGYVAVSQTVADFHAARFTIDSSRIAVVRNAVTGAVAPPLSAKRAEIREQLQLDPQALVLLLVGRIEPVKGQILLVEAVAHCRAAGLSCEVLLAGDVGDSFYAATLQHRLEALGLAPYVKILGPRADVPDLLAAADLFVQPSLFEGLSLAAVEALQAGLPAVLAPTGDATFLLAAQTTEPAGLIFDRPRNDPHLADPKVLFREAAQPAATDIRALAGALQKAVREIEALRVAAKRRGSELREVLHQDRMVRGHADLLAKAIASVGLSGLTAFRDHLGDEAVGLRARIGDEAELLRARMATAKKSRSVRRGILARVRQRLSRFW